MILFALVLVCGCTITQEETRLQYVCSQGQVVADPKECHNIETTSTTEFTTTSTTQTTTTSSTSQTSSTTTWPTMTTTTLCDNSVRGYLIVNDIDDRCYKGYTFRLDENGWDCEIGRESCKIGFIVKKPNGYETSVTARHNIYTGVSFEIDNLVASVFCTHEENPREGEPEFMGVIRFT